MKSRWERVGTPLMQWVAVPLSVFAFCYFVIGPHFSGTSPKPGSSAAGSQTMATSNDLPIQPGRRKWIPVSPPQASVMVTRTRAGGDVPTQSGLGTEPPPDQAPPDGTTTDEGSSSGAMSPPIKRTGGSGAGDPKKPDEKGDAGAFKGVAH